MIEAFRAAGMVPIFAAGNDGPEAGTGQTPAALAGLFPDGRGPLAVAAVDHRLEVLEASSRGPVTCEPSRITFPDLAAPGWNLPVPTAPHPASLTLSSGTSFAVGWVGGVVALMLQVAPEMPVEVVEDLVKSTSRDLPPEGVDSVSGHGLVDPAAAVAAARDWAAANEDR
jgi:subtilisin family serine protease